MAIKTPERGVNEIMKERITLRKRGQFTLPKSIMEHLNLQDGDSFEVRIEDDGTIKLVPLIQVPADQSWFWKDEWQREELEVEKQLRKEQYTDVLELDDALSFLDSLKTKE